MLKNYLKIAVRNLFKNRTYSFINIAGLAMGISVSVLILMFVMHEFSYDKFHKDHKRIYRVMAAVKMGDQTMQTFNFSAKLGPMLKQYNPQVVSQVRVRKVFQKVVIKNPDNSSQEFFENEFAFADPSFFSVFSFPLKEGRASDLNKPFTIIISERAAEKYFGNEDPLGKSLSFEGKHMMQVVGVAENPPSNSSLTFDFVASIATFPQLSERNKNDWEVAGAFNTYLLLDSDQSVSQVTKNIKREGARTNAFSAESEYHLENISSIHLGNNLADSSNSGLINIFIGVAGLILFLALFNYMSLTTARATLRAREVGVRKVVGAGRSGLVKQFYIESALLCSISFGLAFVLIKLLQDSFYSVMDIHIDSSFLFSPSFIGWVIGLLAVSSLIAGSYPAIILSGFAPLEVLKGRVMSSQGSAGVRRFFMVLQFTVSIALIISSLIVKTQLNYMQHKDLGFQKDQILTVPLSTSASKGFFAMKEEIRDMAGVKEVTTANSGLFKPYNMFFLENHKTKSSVGLVTMTVDANFVKTLGLKYSIKSENGTYQNRPHFLLNEVAVKELGLKKNPIGEKILENDEVAGVIKNFNFKSVQSNVEAFGLYVVSDTTNLLARDGAQGLLYVRLDPKADMEENVTAIGRIFKKYDMEKPYEYYFLDDAFNQTFKTEIRMSQMFTVFTGFAIFIACMGLFGLVAFTAEARTKEIGIRKVLGASVAGIVALLSRDFIKLIILAIILAVPIAYYFMEKWLQDFPYRIQIPVWIIAASGALSIVIALLTISFQSIKAALMDPATTLRGE